VLRIVALGMFDRLFNKNADKQEDPIEEYFDSSLGTLIWNEDDESWVGKYKDFKFLISYEGKSKPSSEISRYAKSTLLNNDWLNDILVNCKNSAIKNYPVKRHEEIKSLKCRRICYQGNNMILIQFFEEDDETYWSADIVGGEFKAIGCDT